MLHILNNLETRKKTFGKIVIFIDFVVCFTFTNVWVIFPHRMSVPNDVDRSREISFLICTKYDWPQGIMDDFPVQDIKRDENFLDEDCLCLCQISGENNIE